MISGLVKLTRHEAAPVRVVVALWSPQPRMSSGRW